VSARSPRPCAAARAADRDPGRGPRV